MGMLGNVNEDKDIVATIFLFGCLIKLLRELCCVGCEYFVDDVSFNCYAVRFFGCYLFIFIFPPHIGDFQL